MLLAPSLIFSWPACNRNGSSCSSLRQACVNPDGSDPNLASHFCLALIIALSLCGHFKWLQT
uniref:Uncharacterized protein n=1 Tax=Anguilla anguilla TaxID=7936 RepID=A0A0E9UU38_ANGAN